MHVKAWHWKTGTGVRRQLTPTVCTGVACTMQTPWVAPDCALCALPASCSASLHACAACAVLPCIHIAHSIASAGYPATTGTRRSSHCQHVRHGYRAAALRSATTLCSTDTSTTGTTVGRPCAQQCHCLVWRSSPSSRSQACGPSTSPNLWQEALLKPTLHVARHMSLQLHNHGHFAASCYAWDALRRAAL